MIDSSGLRAAFQRYYGTTRFIWLAQVVAVPVMVVAAFFLTDMMPTPLHLGAEKLVLLLMVLLIVHQVGGSIIIYRQALPKMTADNIWGEAGGDDAEREWAEEDLLRLRQCWMGKNNLLIVCYALSEVTAIYGLILTALTGRTFYAVSFGFCALVLHFLTRPSEERLWRSILQDISQPSGGSASE